MYFSAVFLPEIFRALSEWKVGFEIPCRFRGAGPRGALPGTPRGPPGAPGDPPRAGAQTRVFAISRGPQTVISGFRTLHTASGDVFSRDVTSITLPWGWDKVFDEGPTASDYLSVAFSKCISDEEVSSCSSLHALLFVYRTEVRESWPPSPPRATSESLRRNIFWK